ncbi:MAG: PaaI family thioesterase [Campylobacterota bacterium]|nr:PaaI family thioesterase [Campylobacterota bacterium]
MLDIVKIFQETLGEKMDDYDLPSPSFEIMQCEIVEFNASKKSMLVKMPVLKKFCNPYGTMQGGMTMGAVDNALGPLSMLIAPKNVTRNIESKLLKPITMDIGFIYVRATLTEWKKRRLTFDVTIKDVDETLYTKAQVINWIL